MTRRNWSRLEGFEAWQKEFDVLLVKAAEAAEKDNFSARLKVSGQLTDFISYSRPSCEEIDALDELARKTAISLLRGEIEERLTAIQERTAEYNQLTKIIQTHAANNQERASAIRLEKIQATLVNTSQTITAFKELKDTLDNASATDKEVAKVLEKSIKSLEKLKTDVTKLLA